MSAQEHPLSGQSTEQLWLPDCHIKSHVCVSSPQCGKYGSFLEAETVDWETALDFSIPAEPVGAILRLQEVGSEIVGNKIVRTKWIS